MIGVIRSRLFPALHERFHAERGRLFLELMRPATGSSILDLGGGWGDFLARISTPVGGRSVVADIADHSARAVRERGFEFIRLAEGQPLPFRNGEFDFVVCNSVIEHVTLPKHECNRRMSEAEWRSRSFEQQSRFAEEIRRVGQHFFVQTPDRRFPVEAHTWLPLVNLLSHNGTLSVVKWSDKHWVKKCGTVDWSLLDPERMRVLFPEAEIYVERVLGLPKSVIAYGASRPAFEAEV